MEKKDRSGILKYCIRQKKGNVLRRERNIKMLVIGFSVAKELKVILAPACYKKRHQISESFQRSSVLHYDRKTNVPITIF